MKIRRLATIGLLLAAGITRPAAAQAPDPTFTSPLSLYTTGQVLYMGPQQADGKRVVGGSFFRVNGGAGTGFVRLDAAGAADAAFSQNVGSVAGVSQVLGLPTGQYLLAGGGRAITAGNLTRTELLRLNANGTADASFTVGSGPTSTAGGQGFGEVFAVQPDGKILVAGHFELYNNVPAKGLVRLNADGSVDPTFNVGVGFDLPSFYPGAMAVQPDGKILVGGEFDSFNGQVMHGLVRLNANGSLDASFAAPLVAYSYIEGIVLQPDGKILLNGFVDFLSSGGAAQYTGLARLLPSGALDPNFVTSLFADGGVGYSTEPSVLLQPDGKIIVSGNFTGAAGNRVARLNDTGTLDLTFQVGTGPNTGPATLGLQANGTVLVGGTFGAFSDVEQPLVRLSTAGAVDPAFAPKLQNIGSASVLALQPDGKVVLGGDFTEINGQAVHRLVRLQPNGAVDGAFAAATGVLATPVSSLALQPDGKVVVGTGESVARYLANGSPDAGFTPFASGAGYNVFNVVSLALQADGRVLAAGTISGTANGTPVNGLVRLTTTGAVDPSFTRLVTDPVVGASAGGDAVLVQADGRIVWAGRFRTGPTAFLYRVARYESTGALDATFNNTALYSFSGSTTPGRVFALAQQADGKLLVGGNFNQVDGATRYNVARLTTAGVLDAGFASPVSISGTVRALAIQPNGRVLLGGNISTATTPIRSNLARVLTDGQLDLTFAATANPNGQVRSLAVQPDGGILLTGGFSIIGGQVRLGVARITAPNVLSVQAPAAVAARTVAWPVPAHGQLHVLPDFSARPRALTLLDAAGRAVRTQAVSGFTEQLLEVEGLPAGLYLLQVSYPAGTVTRRIVVQ